MDMNIPKMALQFLMDIGWEASKIEPLADDASFRRYFRVKKDDKQAVLMDAPPPHEDPKPYINMTHYLCENGFRAPQIYGQNLDHGLVLIEDFGDSRMREHLDICPEDEVNIYKQAIDIIIDLPKKQPAKVNNYDEAVYINEVQLLSKWYLPAAKLSVDTDHYDNLWREALRPLYNAPKTTVLRDYHAENIMLLADGALGIIDYQDALIGHQAYDLVSLLQDARRDVSPALEQKMLQYYCEKTNMGEEFLTHYAILGAQRNSKIIGIFARLSARDGKHKYLNYLPRMWGLLERDLEHPDLIALKQWFDENIPQSVRYNKIEGLYES